MSVQSAARRNVCSSGIAASLALLSVDAFAAERGSPLEEVIVEINRESEIAKTGVASAEQPRAVSIVNRGLLDDRVVLEISDALRTVSGFGQVGNYAQFRPSFVLRGFSLSRVFEDGFNIDSGTRSAELAGAERIEVLKGPAGALYGNINPGGIMNLVSKQPDVNEPDSVQLTATSDSMYRSVVDASSGWTQDVAMRGVLAYENGDSYRDYVSRETYFANPSLRWSIGERTTLNALLRYHGARGTHDQGVPISRSLLDLPPERLLNEPTDTAEYDSGAARAWLTHELNAGWRLRAGVNTSIADYDNFFQTFRLPTNSDLGVTGTRLNRLPINEQARAEEYIGQFDVTGDFHVGAMRHRLAVGVEVTVNKRRSTSSADSRYPNSIDYLDPVYVAPVPANLVTDYFDDRSEGGALYVQDQISLTERFDVAVGGRFDSLDMRRLRENTRVVTRRSEDNFAPFVGVTFEATDRAMLFANYSESFTTQVGTQLQGGAMADPNVGSQYEAGIKATTPGGRLSATLSGFRITQENILVSVPGQTYSVQSGEQRSEGAELEVGGNLWRGWDVAFAYTYLDAVVTKDTTLPVGATLVNASDHALSVWNHYRFSGRVEGLTASFGLFCVGERPANLIAPTSSNPGGNTVMLPSYTRFDAGLGYETERWRADLYLENLTDEHYLHARGPVMHPNPPRSVRASLGYRF